MLSENPAPIERDAQGSKAVKSARSTQQPTSRPDPKSELTLRLAGLAVGLGFWVAGVLPVFAWCGPVGMLPVLYLATTEKARSKQLAVAGLYAGLAYTIPQLVALRMHVITSLILLAYMVILMIVLCIGSGFALRQKGIRAAFLLAAWFALFDWVAVHALPIWGAAQSFARPWSLYNEFIAFTSVTGIHGIMFIEGLLAGLAVKMIAEPNKRRFAMTAAATILVIAAADLAILTRPPVDQFTIGAVGWTVNDSAAEQGCQTEEAFKNIYAAGVRLAAQQGARLVVSGEMGFYIYKNTRAEWLARFAEVARSNDVYLAVGYYDTGIDSNRFMFIDPAGEVLCEYVKTYQTPFEPGIPGTGDLQIIEIDGVKVGGMICQDDNFTDLTRFYARQGVGVVVLPTADWQSVKKPHMQSSIARAVEGGYAVVRGAANGESAVINSDGDMLARMDHFDQGPGHVVATVDIHNGGTFYGRTGEWLVALSAALLIVASVRHLLTQND
ncbi:apolipoprotein N-acyltransferase [Anaerohalosphaera lusitana]|uniref:Apolipoprotein N-acyltransferase n=1 Tax=Anaerohalosphaera lusitana TaxID=1936003 RepID=A0A1U9NQK1_9BACT|nr:carbon-nitrogen hydrolase family protein [Anaerohalosphaera lusitana]AQT70189.1 apolipoprotein N-acyltransferase [Anaerohalosphaera lusitana]